MHAVRSISVFAVATIAFALAAASHTPPTASAAPPPFTYNTFDLSVSIPAGALIPEGAPIKPFVDGHQCGLGFVEAATPTMLYGAVGVPLSCAYPGAPVYFLVDGYVLNAPGAWGIGYQFVQNGSAYTPLQLSLSPKPSGRWGGTAIGVPPGTVVQARIGNVVCGEAKTVGGARTRVTSSNYEVQVFPASLPPYGKAYCGFPGAKIDFYVGGVKAQQSPSWSTGLHLMTLTLP